MVQIKRREFLAAMAGVTRLASVFVLDRRRVRQLGRTRFIEWPCR